MARTRCGESASAKVKLNFPCGAVLVWPTSSIPAASLMRMTSSPTDGLLVVPLVTTPFSVAADKDKDDALASNRSVTAGHRYVRIFNRVLTACLGTPALAAPRIPGARSPPGSRRLLPQASFSSPDNPSPEACQP